ncbi:MAG: hypothetical protein LBS72_05350 [Oscillospiraceae bacterium]|jgi:hypothetical protein|nr:hypothetical protein [Oscillospiraceae bacterium]
MKKTLAIVISAVLLLSLSTITALATLDANFTGNIWTNKPTVLGIGYYCTAAQNTSSGTATNRGASAYSKNASGAKIAEASATENNSAVANSGTVKPNSGYGEYHENGGTSGMSFAAGAYN